MIENLRKWDQDLFIFLNNLGVVSHDWFWIFVTKTSSWTLLFVLMVFLIFSAYGKRKGAFVLLYFLGCVFTSIIIMATTKYFIARIRPNNVPELAELIRALQTPHNYSFYSGHASSSFTITTFMVLALRKYHKWVYVFFVFPLLFTWSRVYVGVHYPSDLLVGALIGTIIAFIFHRQCKFYIGRDEDSVNDLNNSADGKTVPDG